MLQWVSQNNHKGTHLDPLQLEQQQMQQQQLEHQLERQLQL
jgi:hypothetical protein